ncbi:hypothetical protein [Segniliparus rugosus]|uniref:Uncharacterized protein n=1 Tax=Segniliparus rugosus (strain ATCC BAA-974 / DSM 45345 / CCUG 50838 / CIP 108380 / JCM 13579 / CDC 945) TaxID=679197 RepID=E5XNN2_SEGRC|nr:hypothetical protein [Segniliparus rugosus]EFV14022.1 hypothetical protein HMPREF9336_01103 [Segniliparus rugosus ATCC BAA-974]
MPQPPSTPEEARDIIHKYLQKTLRELPDGYILDSSRFGGVGGNLSPCDDTPSPESPPSMYDNWRVLVSHSETNYNSIIGKVGDIWRGWGWPVEERNGFDKPNRFSISPDGYTLSIKAAPSGNPQSPPSVIVTSPCFQVNTQSYQAIPEPVVITRDGFSDDKPSESVAPDKPSKLFNW